MLELVAGWERQDADPGLPKPRAPVNLDEAMRRLREGPSQTPGTFTVADLLRFVNEINPIGPTNSAPAAAQRNRNRKSYGKRWRLQDPAGPSHPAAPG